MLIPLIALVLRVAWLGIEWPRVRKGSHRPRTERDRGSGLFWDIANIIEPIGLVLGFWGIGKFPGDTHLIAKAGLILLVACVAFRWMAIHSLGELFTYNVTIQSEHQLVRRGPYRYLRHPAYTGSLMAHLGLGLALSSWVSLACSSVPYFVATIYRVKVEERALRERFGKEYGDYCDQTQRLIPWIY